MKKLQAIISIINLVLIIGGFWYIDDQNKKHNQQLQAFEEKMVKNMKTLDKRIVDRIDFSASNIESEIMRLSR